MKFNINDLVIVKDSIQPNTNVLIYKVAIHHNGDYLLKFHGDLYPFASAEIHEYDHDFGPRTRSWRSSFQRYEEDELISLDDGLVEWKRLTESKSQMETEFTAVRSKVEEKMQAAVAIVKEVNALILPLDKDLCDLRKECKPLYEALDEGGWRSSHFRC